MGWQSELGQKLEVVRLELHFEMGCLMKNLIYIQLSTSDYKQLLNKPYENEVTLTWQNPPLKCC